MSSYQKVWFIIAFIVINIETFAQKIIIILNNLQNVINQIKQIIFEHNRNFKILRFITETWNDKGL